MNNYNQITTNKGILLTYLAIWGTEVGLFICFCFF